MIGHSFGGLIAQKLLACGAAAAAIAIDPGQIKGVKPLPFAQIRSGLPVLSKPGNKKRAVMLTKKQFRYGFGNVLTERESGELFDKWAIPGPGKPLFEASAANFKKSSPAAVDTRQRDRGPLLIVAGGKDHTVPEVVARAAYKLYSGSGAVTGFTLSLTAATRSSSITDGVKSRTSPCPGSPARACDNSTHQLCHQKGHSHAHATEVRNTKGAIRADRPCPRRPGRNPQRGRCRLDEQPLGRGGPPGDVGGQADHRAGARRLG